jgi:hypothetical protein
MSQNNHYGVTLSGCLKYVRFGKKDHCQVTTINGLTSTTNKTH